MHKFTYFSKKREYEVALDDVNEYGAEINEKEIINLKTNLSQKIDELILIKSQMAMRYDTILIVDYDNTIILRDQNTLLQNILFPNECNLFISNNIMNQRGSDSQMSQKFAKNLGQISQLIERRFDEHNLQTIMNTQYALLNFLNIILDFLIQSRIHKVYLVSSSSITLILKGIFIISNAMEYINSSNYDCTYNPVLRLFENSFLDIISTANNPFPQKQKTFANLVSDIELNEGSETTGIKHLISIGDGPDEELSAKLAGQIYEIQVHVYRFLFDDYEDIQFSSLLQFHKYLSQYLLNENPIFISDQLNINIPIVQIYGEPDLNSKNNHNLSEHTNQIEFDSIYKSNVQNFEADNDEKLFQIISNSVQITPDQEEFQNHFESEILEAQENSMDIEYSRENRYVPQTEVSQEIYELMIPNYLTNIDSISDKAKIFNQFRGQSQWNQPGCFEINHISFNHKPDYEEIINNEIQIR